MDLKQFVWTEFTAAYIKPRTHTLRVVAVSYTHLTLPTTPYV